MPRNIELTSFSTLVCLDYWSVHMHEEFVLFPGPRGYVKERYLVGPSVFVLDSELVSFEKVVFGRNELDS